MTLFAAALCCWRRLSPGTGDTRTVSGAVHSPPSTMSFSSQSPLPTSRSAKRLSELDRLHTYTLRNPLPPTPEFKHVHSHEVPEFRPSESEFSDFEAYIVSLEERGLVTGGLARIIPPASWLASMPSPADYQTMLDQITIQAPIRQLLIHHDKGAFRVLPEIVRPEYMSVADFKLRAEEMESIRTSRELAAIRESGTAEIERAFWRNVSLNPAIYGADTPGTLFPASVTEWNLDNLPGLLNRSSIGELSGVSTSYLYFGMWKSLFAWHTEDADLYSINYVHIGAPKFWYAVPPQHAHKLETLANMYFPFEAKRCPQFLRHKQSLLTPALLERHGVPFIRGIQQAGEFMVTFPRAYHAGFNSGFNVAEAVNFVTERWVPFGRSSIPCVCSLPDLGAVAVSEQRMSKRQRTLASMAADNQSVLVDVEWLARRFEQRKHGLHSDIDSAACRLPFSDDSDSVTISAFASVSAASKPRDDHNAEPAVESSSSSSTDTSRASSPLSDYVVPFAPLPPRTKRQYRSPKTAKLAEQWEMPPPHIMHSGAWLTQMESEECKQQAQKRSLPLEDVIDLVSE